MRLQLDRCPACGHVCNFPRVACPVCLGELDRVDAAGRGRVATFSVVHRWTERFQPHLPIVLAVIELEEGVEIVSSLVGDDRLDVAIGDEVEVAPDGWAELPQFRRVAAAA
ncbi:MAG: OB-fold domain-containing protein [Thermoleophilia bacterium]